MTRLETAASIWGHILAAVGASDRGMVSLDMLVIRDGLAGRCTIIVPCGSFHWPSLRERGQHRRLRAAGHRVVIVRTIAEADLALIRYRCFARARREAWANRLALAMAAVELPVRRVA